MSLDAFVWSTLKAWGAGADFSRNTRGGIYEVNYTNKRTNVVRLLPNGFQKRKLRRLSNISSKLFNELNYERRQQFFHEKKVDFNKTWNKYYEKYKEELKVNAQAVMQKSNEAWNSFFSSKAEEWRKIATLHETC